jgi:hypothetical protein
MPTSNAESAAGKGVLEGTRGPDDDFFCHKYQVWYRVEDCVYRGTNKTFTGCVNCFQGRLNIRSHEKGLKPPAFIGSHLPLVPEEPGSSRTDTPGTVLPFSSAPRGPCNGTGA